MAIIIANHRLSSERIQREHGDVVVLDMTSHGPEPWVRFSPFYPHGGIPVPFSPGYTSMTVEGIWQGLKVFERAGIDPSKMEITTMKGIKRTVRSYGRVLGHRAGFITDHLLSYGEARRAIYLPLYRWILEHKLHDLLSELRQRSNTDNVVLLDYETNCDVDDLSRPLSHAGLVERYLEGNWPMADWGRSAIGLRITDSGPE